MPWSNQSGGGGPWGQRGGSGGKSPWGSGGSQGNGNPPDLEDILRRGQDRLRDFIPGGSMGGKGLILLVLAVVAIWLLTGFYTVRPNEVGINMVFGRYSSTSGEGLRYNYPYPIGRVIKPTVTAQQRVEVGYRSTATGQGRARDVIEESLMLTGDENIVDIDFDAVWQINPARPQDYVFNLQNPDGTIKSVAESAMREVIGRRNIQAILTTEQASIAGEVRQIMQEALDAYGAGVLINVVQLQAARPPSEVQQAFFDVNAAQQDAVRVQNEALAYASRIVPEARGEASRIVQQAEAYREQSVADATGQAARFRQVYEEYRKAPDVSRERIFLETMERVFGGVDKIIVDQKGQGVVPFLPLNQMPQQQNNANNQGTTR